MHNAAGVRSRYFDRRDIVIGEDQIVLIACMRNEYQRLPYFLEYYRQLGVDRFLFVDNNSTDGTDSFLREQHDVEYFRTTSSYRGSSAGRLWMQELADSYAVDRWVITADVDELLVFPGIEELDLRDLCDYLDAEGYEGLFTILLDMYSDVPVESAHYTPGTDFLKTCQFFETDGYRFGPSAFPPFLTVTGGPRLRLFEANARRGPSMKKVPLIRWQQGFSYVYSTHSHRFLPLADITGLLLHFKFFASFEGLVAGEALRGDRRQHADYRIYRDALEEGISLFGPQSLCYESPSKLVELGLMCSTTPYARFVEERISPTPPQGELDTSDTPAYVGRLLPSPEDADGRGLRALPTIWPLVNNRGVATYFGVAGPRNADSRAQFVRSMRRYVSVVDVAGDHLLIRLDEPALHRWERSGLALALYVSGQLLLVAPLDGSDPRLEVDTNSLEASLFRLEVDLLRATQDTPPDEAVTITAYLCDAMEGAGRRAGDDRPETDAPPEDVLIHDRPWHPGGITTSLTRRFEGRIERLVNGEVRGWAYDVFDRRFDLPVNFYIDGRLARHVRPLERRRHLAKRCGHANVRTARGFRESLPIARAQEETAAPVTIEAYIAGTNVALRHSPLLLPRDATCARWDRELADWVTGDESVFENLVEPDRGSTSSSGIPLRADGQTAAPAPFALRRWSLSRFL